MLVTKLGETRTRTRLYVKIITITDLCLKNCRSRVASEMGLLLFLRVVSRVADIFACPFLAVIYPLCVSIWAIESNATATIMKLTKYWVLFALFLLLELLLAKLLEWLPLWPLLKLVFICLFVMPHFDGASHAYVRLSQELVTLKLVSDCFLNLKIKPDGTESTPTTKGTPEVQAGGDSSIFGDLPSSSPRSVRKEWICSLCFVRIHSKATLDQHLNGKQHAENMKLMRAKLKVFQNKAAFPSSPTKKSNSKELGAKSPSCPTKKSNSEAVGSILKALQDKAASPSSPTKKSNFEAMGMKLKVLQDKAAFPSSPTKKSNSDAVRTMKSISEAVGEKSEALQKKATSPSSPTNKSNSEAMGVKFEVVKEKATSPSSSTMKSNSETAGVFLKAVLESAVSTKKPNSGAVRTKLKVVQDNTASSPTKKTNHEAVGAMVQDRAASPSSPTKKSNSEAVGAIQNSEHGEMKNMSGSVKWADCLHRALCEIQCNSEGNMKEHLRGRAVQHKATAAPSPTKKSDFEAMGAKLKVVLDKATSPSSSTMKSNSITVGAKLQVVQDNDASPSSSTMKSISEAVGEKLKALQKKATSPSSPINKSNSEAMGVKFKAVEDKATSPSSSTMKSNSETAGAVLKAVQDSAASPSSPTKKSNYEAMGAKLKVVQDRAASPSRPTKKSNSGAVGAIQNSPPKDMKNTSCSEKLADGLHCALCEIRCSSEGNMKEHLTGRKHSEQLSIWEQSGLWCSLCEIRTNSKVDMVGHLRGRKHSAQISILAQAELWCRLCEVRTTSKVNMVDHLNGRMHLSCLDFL